MTALVTREALLLHLAPRTSCGFQNVLLLCARVCGNGEHQQIYLHPFIPILQRQLLRVISEVIVIFLISESF